MKPIKFKEQTGVLLKPPSMSVAECGSLPICREDNSYRSCWKMSFKERIVAMFYGKVWMRWCGEVKHPPVSLTCTKTVFNR